MSIRTRLAELPERDPFVENWFPFVILSHSFPEHHPRENHFDWMFSDGIKLLTWTTLELPEANTKLTATWIADHRLAYLEYEGPISRDRGQVRRIEQGMCCFNKMEVDRVQLHLRGTKYHGLLTFSLRCDAEWELELVG